MKSKILILVLLFLSIANGREMKLGRHVKLIEIEGVIDSIVSNFIANAVRRSERDGAECLIIRLNTPGGLMNTTQEITRTILNSSVPVVVYVAPGGAWAESAGTFITIAADIAVMAPGTTIGSAHPVEITGQKASDKVVNASAAYIRSVALSKGRNAKWAEDAVRKSVSATAKEALDLKVVDLVAPNLDILLNKLDNKEVKKANFTKVIKTKGATVRKFKMNPAQIFLHSITDPNIAYLLLILGINGLIYEFIHPGAIYPGVTGAICLLCAWYALASLPVNLVGLLLILLGLILLIVEAKTAGFSGFGVGGIVALAMGSFMLFTAPVPELRASRWLITAVVVVSSLSLLLVLTIVIRSFKRKLTTGVESVIGAVAKAKTDLRPTGIVFYMGEEWSAEAIGEHIRSGEDVKVISVEGLRLKVDKV